MSRSINIRGQYRNNVAVNRGLFCKYNCDMVPNLFTASEIHLLICRFYQEVGSKRLKGNVVVTLRKSGSTYDSARYIRVTVSLLDLYLYSQFFSVFFEEHI